MESMLPYLPPLDRTGPSSLCWPSDVKELLDKIRGGPPIENVWDFCNYICGLRAALKLSPSSLSYEATCGFNHVFGKGMSEAEQGKWFGVVIPKLANLLLRLPGLLEKHYGENADDIALRILQSQQRGFVCLSQELIAALLACSLFCLFPVERRRVKRLPMINFDQLLETMPRTGVVTKFVNKIWCIIMYFHMTSYQMPEGNVSFERRVLHRNASDYPDAESWFSSTKTLCEFQVHTSGRIEDQSRDAVEVYFAGKDLGGYAFGNGISQDEIRFMLSPELIGGMIFLPAMQDNEAIEIVGAQRFTTYSRYCSSFRLSAVDVDDRGEDEIGRHKTRVVAVDKFCTTKAKEDIPAIYLREINKAFCGFLYPLKYQSDSSGIATGDCDPLEKAPVMKAIIMWLAASQAERPFIAYFTHGMKALQNLDEVVSWILSQGWTVGHLWDKLIFSKVKNDAGFLQLVGFRKSGSMLLQVGGERRSYFLQRMKNMLPYLPPLHLIGSSLCWPSGAEAILLAIQDGLVQSGQHLVVFICLLRKDLSLSSDSKFKSGLRGFQEFFDMEMSKEESNHWFRVVLPKLATWLLKLPSLLEQHYGNDDVDILRILESQKTGVVCLSLELIAALLACSLFCLFPINRRRAKCLPMINFNRLFEPMFCVGSKIWSIISYFERRSSEIPSGNVSFERKVLHKNGSAHPSYPDAAFWSKSTNTLCKFVDLPSESIEDQDQSADAVEVYFDAENLWGNAPFMVHKKGRIIRRFMVSPELICSPELIAGMLFLPAINNNEAVEIVGAEVFSSRISCRCGSSHVAYDGCVDETGLRTRKTRIVAVAKSFTPGNKDNMADIYLCDINKAFCGFLNQQDSEYVDIGVATADWYGGINYKDCEMRAIIKWLAASQAGRPFISYFTADVPFQIIGKVTRWILSRGWTVGDLWNRVIEYSAGNNDVCFSQWVGFQEENT